MGIGAAIAHALAGQGVKLALVSRTEVRTSEPR
jgi:short-subunit dehydrogenase